MNITADQIKAIQAYVDCSVDGLIDFETTKALNLSTTGFSFQLNGILRANLLLTPEINLYLTQIDSAFDNHSITESLTVYRVCNYQEMIRYLTNDKYFDFGYMSTSKVAETTQQFYQGPNLGYLPAFIKFEIPPTSKVLDLENINGYDNTTYEGEVLIKRKSQFDVICNEEVETTDNLLEIIGRQTQVDFKTMRFLELKFIKYFG